MSDDDLALSLRDDFRNGNRTHVLQELATMSTSRGLYVAVQVYDGLDAFEQESFLSLLRQRIESGR
jgi:hypothetical protein